MRVAIDGFALAVPEGTGVTRYALELSQTLVKAQHPVFPVYGLNRVGRIAKELPMTTKAITPLRQRMIEDMNARKLCAGTQRGHIRSCKRFAAFLKQSPDTATAEDIRRFQLHLSETGASICNRNRIMTGLRFLFRVTLRRLDLAAEIYHIREPQKIPLVMS